MQVVACSATIHNPAEFALGLLSQRLNVIRGEARRSPVLRHEPGKCAREAKVEQAEITDQCPGERKETEPFQPQGLDQQGHGDERGPKRGDVAEQIQQRSVRNSHKLPIKLGAPCQTAIDGVTTAFNARSRA